VVRLLHSLNGNEEKLKLEKDLAVANFFNRTTPKSVIYKREGRGKKSFDYVKGYWIINQLNLLFDHCWSWEVVRESIGTKQIWVLGTLTIEGEIKKSAYGGSDIKVYSDGRGTIDIADDLKAASMDALKKAASLLGVAFDIYSGLDEDSSSTGVDPTKWKSFLFRGQQLGMNEESLRAWIRVDASNPSGLEIEDLTPVQQDTILRRLVAEAQKK